jgi:hypothetical protein
MSGCSAVIRGYRVLWVFDGRAKIDDFFSRREAVERANNLVSLNHRGVRLQRRHGFNGEFKDVRPSEWDVTVRSDADR